MDVEIETQKIIDALTKVPEKSEHNDDELKVIAQAVVRPILIGIKALDRIATALEHIDQHGLKR